MRLQVSMRAPDDGVDVWLLALNDEGQVELRALFDPQCFDAILPLLRERVEHESIEGDTDGKAHLRRELLQKLDDMAVKGLLR